MLGDNISTKYKDRETTYLDIVSYIEGFVGAKKGNYFVFFPSYVYMNNIYEILVERNQDLNIIKQESNMSELERETFLSCFHLQRPIGLKHRVSRWRRSTVYL